MADYKYLVVSRYADEDDSAFDARIMTAAEIFNMMDMADCFPCEMEMDISRINGVGMQLTDCSFRGKWHDPKDPLKMVIVGGGIRETGYGTDH